MTNIYNKFIIHPTTGLRKMSFVVTQEKVELSQGRTFQKNQWTLKIQ